MVFGPILSRRFGLSLGVDLSPEIKQCNFNCVYCELKASAPVDIQTKITPVETFLDSISSALKKHNDIDVLTFSANGEPTLYPMLEQLIIESKKLLAPYPHIKTLILSNGARLYESREALRHFDIVKFSLDSIDERIFKRIDKPSKHLHIESIKDGIKKFAKYYNGDLVAEILIVKDINDDIESNMRSAAFLRKLGIKRLDLSSIDRPSSHRVFPVSNDRLYELSEVFSGINVSVALRKSDDLSIVKQNLDKAGLLDLIARRPLTHNDCNVLLSRDTLDILAKLVDSKEIVLRDIAGMQFYYVT